jgi:hypothetical protein
MALEWHFETKISMRIQTVNLKIFAGTTELDARSKACVYGHSFARIVGSNPAGAWMSVSCELSGEGLCAGLITRPEQSDCGVSECDRGRFCCGNTIA